MQSLDRSEQYFLKGLPLLEGAYSNMRFSDLWFKDSVGFVVYIQESNTGE